MRLGEALLKERAIDGIALSDLEQGLCYGIDPPITVAAIPALKEDRHFGWRNCTFSHAVYLGIWDDRILLRGQPTDPTIRESLCWIQRNDLHGRVLKLSPENF